MASLKNPNGISNTNPTGMMTSGGRGRTVYNKVLRLLSSWGQDYEGMTYKNTVGVPRGSQVISGFTPDSANTYSPNSQYASFANALANRISEKRMSFFDKSYPQMRNILVDYARKERIRDYINIVSQEMVIYDTENKRFCNPNRLESTFGEEVARKMEENFNALYTQFRFNDGVRAWHLAKRLLIEGYLAFEIVFDDRQRRVLNIVELDHTTLVQDIDPYTGEFLWVQYPEDPVNRRIFLDSQIIYISYAMAQNEGEISYVENLIRPYNILSVLEDSKIIWSITTATLYRKFLIPVDGLSPTKAEEEIGKIIATYDDDIDFDNQYGFPKINGQRSLQAYKDVWLPKESGNSPEIEFIDPPALNLQDDTLLVYFREKLELASMIPNSRLTKDGRGGAMFDSIAEVTRDERDFSKFISRLQMIFKELIVKPLWIQMVLDYPEYKNDMMFKSKVDVEFVKDNIFEKWRFYSTLDKQSTIISNLANNIKDENDKPFFSPRFLVEEILDMSREQLERNAQYKMSDGISSASGGGGGDDSGLGGDEGDGGEEGGDEGGITL